jgi:hypothetical protein
MIDKDEQPLPSRTKGKLFAAVSPSSDDLTRAATIPANQCPRRYCWWWRSLDFDWTLTPLEGCTFLSSPKPSGVANADIPCCRCDAASSVDHYEPREPHLLQDGFAIPRWHSSAHLWPNGEISYDLAMGDDMEFVEGSFRIGGCDWQVLIFAKRPIDELTWKTCAWDSGVSGIVVHVPKGMRLNANVIETFLTRILGVRRWERVQGPSSMQLR